MTFNCLPLKCVIIYRLYLISPQFLNGHIKLLQLIMLHLKGKHIHVCGVSYSFQVQEQKVCQKCALWVVMFRNQRQLGK